MPKRDMLPILARWSWRAALLVGVCCFALALRSCYCYARPGPETETLSRWWDIYRALFCAFLAAAVLLPYYVRTVLGPELRIAAAWPAAPDSRFELTMHGTALGAIVICVFMFSLAYVLADASARTDAAYWIAVLAGIGMAIAAVRICLYWRSRLEDECSRRESDAREQDQKRAAALIDAALKDGRAGGGGVDEGLYTEYAGGADRGPGPTLTQQQFDDLIAARRRQRPRPQPRPPPTPAAPSGGKTPAPATAPKLAASQQTPYGEGDRKRQERLHEQAREHMLRFFLNVVREREFPEHERERMYQVYRKWCAGSQVPFVSKAVFLQTFPETTDREKDGK